MKAVISFVDSKGLAQKNEARGLVRDCQGVTVLAVAELEFTLEIGAPQLIGSHGI